jgi:uncharacterized membrane protein YGL010W
MRDLASWFADYAADHQHPVNRRIHWICVPAILWAAIALLWLLPVPAWLGRPGFWCGLVLVGAVSWYWRLSHRIGIAMFVVLVALAFATEGLRLWLGPAALLWLAATVLVLAWIGQFAGHAIEGRRPSFTTDLAYLLVGPAWLADKLMRRVGAWG